MVESTSSIAQNRPRQRVIDPSQGMRSQISQQQLVLVLISVMLGMLLSAVDQTVVGTAMPRIIADLNGLKEYAWVTTSYMLASTVTVPLYGKLSDIYGRKPFFLLGMILFLLGSALSGTSQNMTQLILFRGIQGLGAGALMPIVIAIIGDIFPPAERGKWQGLLMAVFGLASILGPWAGGAITDHWGWRYVFYVHMPIGALALIFCVIALPSAYRKTEHLVDVWGAVLLAVAAVPMLLGFSWAGNQYPWGNWHILSAFAVALAGWIAFAWWELRFSEPIISPRLFKNSVFAISVLASFLVTFGMFGAIMYIPLFMQAVVGDSAQNSGVMLTPMMLGFMVSSIVGGQIMSRTGKYKALSIVTLAIAIVGMWLLSHMGATSTNGLVVRNMVVMGLGIGTMMSLFTIVVQNAFPFNMIGSVTANLQFFRSIGGTVGIAVLGSVLTSRFTHALPHKIPLSVQRLAGSSALSGLANPSVLLSPDANAELTHAFARFGRQGLVMAHELLYGIRAALSLGIDRDFFIGAILLAVALVTLFFLPEIPLRKQMPGMPEPPSTRSIGYQTRLAVGVALAQGLLQGAFTSSPGRRQIAVAVAERLLRQGLAEGMQVHPGTRWEPQPLTGADPAPNGSWTPQYFQELEEV
jgi:EmrB/QacA subfamily drug resistance transporter